MIPTPAIIDHLVTANRLLDADIIRHARKRGLKMTRVRGVVIIHHKKGKS